MSNRINYTLRGDDYVEMYTATPRQP
jgi:hypothetical protein